MSMVLSWGILFLDLLHARQFYVSLSFTITETWLDVSWTDRKSWQGFCLQFGIVAIVIGWCCDCKTRALNLRTRAATIFVHLFPE